MKWKSIFKFGFLTLLSVALIYVVRYDFTSLSYFAPMEKASDFLASDLYLGVGSDMKVKKAEENIAVVPVDNIGRRELIDVLNLIAEGNPSVVAVDIRFAQLDDDTDSLLLDAMSRFNKAILPVVLNNGQVEMDGKIDFGTLDNITLGVVNFDYMTDGETKRRFVPIYSTADGTPYPSFAAAAVGRYDAESLRKLNERGNGHELINFVHRQILTIDPNEIADDPSQIEGMMIFVGDNNVLSDSHAISTGEVMSGVMIHAFTASTILHGDYINEVSIVLQWLLAVAICILMIGSQMKVSKKRSGNMYIRLLQLVVLGFLIVGGTCLYLKFNYVLDLTIPLLMGSFGLIAADFASLALAGLDWIQKFWREKLSKKIKIPSLTLPKLKKS